MSSIPVNTGAFRPGSFADAMLEPPAGHKKKRMMQSVISIGVHTSVLAVLVMLPLFVSSSLSLKQLDRTVLLTPAPPAAPAPLRPIIEHAAVAPKYAMSTAKLMVPTVVPKTISMSAPEMASAPAVSSAGGVMGGFGSVFGGDGIAAPPPPPAIASSAPKKPVMITGDMKQPVLIYRPEIVYPPIAKAAHVQGIVVVEAVIDEHGNVVQAHAVSGPGLLFQEALKAVSSSKYQPTNLDGQPTAIDLHVEVQFHMAM
jgi:protein TonB